MSSLEPPRRLTGYVALTGHGFALPVYGLATEHGSAGNAPYVAIPEVEGDRQGSIANFDILNVVNMGVHWLPGQRAEIAVGDPWQDVFLWKGEVVAGTARHIFDSGRAWHDDLRRDAPLTYLDLALGAGAETTAAAARSALEFLVERLGEKGGARSFRDIVVSPGVLLELHRHNQRTSPQEALPDSVRDFLVEPAGVDRFSVRLAPGSVTRLGGEEAFSGLVEAIAAFGRRIGADLQTIEDPGITEAERPHPRPAVPLEGPPEPPAGFLGSASRAVSAQEIAIDLGTANTRIFVKGRGIVLDEPSVAAIETVNGAKRIRAVGSEAVEAARKDPDSVELIRPMRDGVIADIDVAERMIEHFFKSVRGRRPFLRRPTVIICVPSGSTSIERRAVREVLEFAGAGKVWLIEQPMAAAIGAGMAVTEPFGTLIVDIGSGTTEVAVVAVGGLAYAVSARVGGDVMDQAISSYIRRNHALLISESRAERIKMQFGRARPPVDSSGRMTGGATIIVKGRDAVSGAPKEITINEMQIAEALSEPLGSIVEIIRIALENTAPELSADIVDQGIVLAGGGALIEGIAEMIRDETGLPVAVAEEPLGCVAKGLGEVLNRPQLHSVLS